MHFPPVKNLCPAVSGKSTECVCGGGKTDTRPLQKPPVHPLKKETPAAHGFCLRPTKITPAALNVLRRAILLPRAVEPMAPRLHPTFSGELPPMADFRPGGQGRFGAFLRPQCRSRGVLSPRFFQAGTWPFSGLCGTRRTASSDMIRLSGSAFSQSHSYHTASGRKSQRSAPCKTAVYCRTAKTAAAARSPLVLPEKRCIIKASGTGRENRGMLPGKACPHPSKK